MTDYIRRTDALEITTRTCGDYAAAFAEIRKIPAADVVEVVRCASCKYVRPTINFHTGEQVGLWCYLHDSIDVSPDDYCRQGATE